MTSFARRLTGALSGLIFTLFMIIPFLGAEENPWDGPVRIEEYSFDEMAFYVIGWSRQGRFAYGTTRPGRSGTHVWQWFVQDLVEDRNLYTSPEWMLLEGQTPGELWDLHPEWHPQLVRFGVSVAEKPAGGERIFREEGASYRMTATMDRSETPENPEGLTREIRISLFRNNNTAKTIYSYNPDPARDFVDDLVLKGYARSPFEKRIAVVALEKSGPDALRAEWTYRVIGAHLTVGFSPVAVKGSALVEAVLNGQYYVSRMLLQGGADTEEKDSRGYTPLLLAARRGLWDILELFLDAGADVRVSDDSGRTPLHYAVEAGKTDAVKVLLTAGSDPGRKDGRGRSALVLAQLQGNRELEALLRDPR